MNKLQIIKNDKTGYGLKDLDSGIVIIPCMYRIDQVDKIVEVLSLTNTIFLLTGLSENNDRIYGLYDFGNNIFLDLNYDKIEFNDGNIVLFTNGSEEVYDNEKHDVNKPFVGDTTLLTDDGENYGLRDSNSKLVIPKQFSRKEIFNIGSSKEIMPNVFILYDRYDDRKIVGFFDGNVNRLEKGTFTSYELNNDTLLLKNKVLKNLNHPSDVRFLDGESRIRSKIYYSIYDLKHNEYITGDQYYDNEVWKLDFDGRDAAWFYVVEKNNNVRDGVWILNDSAIYDTRTGFLKTNIECYLPYFDSNTDDIHVYSHNNDFMGFYNIRDKKMHYYSKINVDSFSDEQENIYECDYDGRKEYVYRYNRGGYFYLLKLAEYSDFFIAMDSGLEKKFTVLFDKNFNVLGHVDQTLHIVEFDEKTLKELGINNEYGTSSYLINGKLYNFNNTNQPLLNIGDRKRIPSSFIEPSMNCIGYCEYEYGIGVVNATSEIELDYMLEQLDNDKSNLSHKVENIFYDNKILQKKYPKLIKKAK